MVLLPVQAVEADCVLFAQFGAEVIVVEEDGFLDEGDAVAQVLDLDVVFAGELDEGVLEPGGEVLGGRSRVFRTVVMSVFQAAFC